ncbi:hypothetical protein TNCV_3617581 [Trichonephila clavipes]|nr:hypothetical protein TNCV_3617581 [Trichonephila clavipes]
MLPVLGKKAVLELCMKECLIGSSYGCLKCGKSIELREKTAFITTTPEHILDCLRLALEDVHASPLLVLDVARVNPEGIGHNNKN